MISSVALNAVYQLPLGLRSIHGDITSVYVTWSYEPAKSDLRFIGQNLDRRLFNITYGYSKDHRPDLKQLKFGLLVSSEGMPLLGEAGDCPKFEG